MFFIELAGHILSTLEGKKNRLIATYQKSKFKKCGENVSIGDNCHFIPDHIIVGNNVCIGRANEFLASIANIYIGNYVLFGPHVTIRGGDHRTDLIGKHIIEIGDSEKLAQNDADVHIEDGVWIGGHVVILKGVTIGKGSIVGAGSVVTKSIPPYSIAVGNPAKVIKKRFTEEDIRLHEKILRERNV